MASRIGIRSTILYAASLALLAAFGLGLVLLSAFLYVGNSGGSRETFAQAAVLAVMFFGSCALILFLVVFIRDAAGEARHGWPPSIK